MSASDPKIMDGAIHAIRSVHTRRSAKNPDRQNYRQAVRRGLPADRNDDQLDQKENQGPPSPSFSEVMSRERKEWPQARGEKSV